MPLIGQVCACFFARSIHGADILEHQSFQHTNLTPPMRARVVFIIFLLFSDEMFRRAPACLWCESGRIMCFKRLERGRKHIEIKLGHCIYQPINNAALWREQQRITGPSIGHTIGSRGVTTQRFTHRCSSKSVSPHTVSGDLHHIHTDERCENLISQKGSVILCEGGSHNQ